MPIQCGRFTYGVIGTRSYALRSFFDASDVRQRHHQGLDAGAHVYFCESRILASLASPRVACHSLQMLTEGVWSEIRVGGECLRLFSEDCAQGVLASVYNVNGKTWIAPSEPVDNIQQGKVKAEAYAKAYLKNSVNLELPSLEWKSSRSI